MLKTVYETGFDSVYKLYHNNRGAEIND